MGILRTLKDSKYSYSWHCHKKSFCRFNFYDYISEEQDKMVLKLCDFGQARNIDRTEGMTSHLGTPSWTAPEVYAKASRLIYFENFYYVQWPCSIKVHTHLCYEFSTHNQFAEMGNHTCLKTANPKILGLVPLLQICKFRRFASLQIANLQITN